MKTTSNCVDCCRDTSFGTGLYVNRIPASNDELDGWLCIECQTEKCSVCNKNKLDYVFNKNGDVVCNECN